MGNKWFFVIETHESQPLCINTYCKPSLYGADALSIFIQSVMPSKRRNYSPICLKTQQ